MNDLLGRPVWHALTTGWAPLAEGDARAWRLRRDHGVFGAAADRSAENMAALAALIPPDGELWTLESDDWSAPAGTVVLRTADCVQMAATALTPSRPPAFDIVPLAEADAAAMYDLATLTRPGPYVANTHRLGDFIGVKQDGRLIAMAGERMKMPGWREVSGVCTHPDHRGRGYAAGLIRVVAARMLARGETPFLHAYADNAGAIAIYESLGFRIAGRIRAHILARP